MKKIQLVGSSPLFFVEIISFADLDRVLVERLLWNANVSLQLCFSSYGEFCLLKDYIQKASAPSFFNPL